MKTKSNSIYDILGISASSLCLIHCIAFPLLTILPLGFSHNKIIDLIFAIIGIVIGLKIIVNYSSVTVKIIFGFAIVILIASILLSLVFNIHNELVVLGGVAMIIGHIINYRNNKH